jgi:hypothetical protein
VLRRPALRRPALRKPALKVPALSERAVVAGDWLRDKTGRLIEAVDPAPGADLPRVPLDTLLDDAVESGVATGPERRAARGSR